MRVQKFGNWEKRDKNGNWEINRWEMGKVRK